MAAANTAFNITDVEQLLKCKVAEVTAEDRQEAGTHVETLKVEIQRVIYVTGHIEPFLSRLRNTTKAHPATALLLTATSLLFDVLMRLEEDDDSTYNGTTASNNAVFGC